MSCVGTCWALMAVCAAFAHSVLVMVDPVRRVVEVVTGAEVRRRLPDVRVNFAVLQMETAFAQGDLVGGITSGVAMMADTAAES